MFKKWITYLFIGILFGGLSVPKTVGAFDPADVLTVGMAFLTNLSVHESAHYIVANQAGASGNRIQFFSEKNGNFFFGLSTVDAIDPRNKLAYNLAGEFATDILFDCALDQYRKEPTLYTKSLLFFSGTDFLWYSLYAFYLAPEKDPMYDPIGVAEGTGLSHNAIFGLVATEFAFKAIRVATGEEWVDTYMTLEPEKVGFGLKFRF